MASDGVFNLYEGNAVTWGREEALASVPGGSVPGPAGALARAGSAVARGRADAGAARARRVSQPEGAPRIHPAHARPSRACSRLAAAGLHA